MNAAFRGVAGGAAAVITVGPDALDVDGRRLPYVDMDLVEADGHRVSLRMHRADGVVLGGFGARHDAFLDALDEARGTARRAALLQWTGTPPIDRYRQAAAAPGQAPTAVYLFPDGLTVEPRNGTPELVPFGLLERVERAGHTLRLHRRAGLEPVTVHRLGARTDEFERDLAAARATLVAALAAGFGALDARLAGVVAPNGWAVPASVAGVPGRVLDEAFAGAGRAEELAVLGELAAHPLRYGLALQPGGAMPFVLVPGRTAVAVEAVGADAGRATYVFATPDVDALNVALVLTSFRREALYLPEDELGRWALAARTLPVVRWARASLAARVVHGPAWADQLRAALG